MALNKLIKGVLGTLVVAMPLSAPHFAEQRKMTGITVVKTSVSDGMRFGGCMAQLSEAPSTVGLTCDNSGNDRPWVTFSCSGEHTSKADGLRMFDSAQMAFALGRQVDIWVEDAKKTTPDGFCFVTRIDVLPEAVPDA